MNIKNLILSIFFLLASFVTTAQEHTTNDEINSHDENEKEPGFETVLSGLFMYTPETGNFDPATELHVTYWTSHTWAFGISYSMAFEEEGRVGHELAPLVSHKPWHFLTLNLGPSFSMPNSHKDLEVSGYFEGEFNFKIGEFHTGPLVGTLIGKEFKLTAGIHLGYEF